MNLAWKSRLPQAPAARRGPKRCFHRPGPASTGFTLVEVIIAVAVMAIGFVAIYSAVAMNLSIVHLCRDNETATQILTEKLDTIRLYNWDQINSNGFIPASFTVPLDPGSSTGPPYFTGTVSVAQAPVTEGYGPNMRLVTVRLDWVSGNRPQTRTMSTFFSRYGLQNYVIR